MDIALANTAAARAFVRGLTVAGVENVCISPGSRSTPLTVAFAEQRAIRPWLHLDERSSAYFALGLARATGRPVTLVCTSGTAAANFLPAVAEAGLSNIPLVVCTTDRPPHLRRVGAAQTMDQVNLYGAHVRWAADLALPAGTTADAALFAAQAERAVRAALGALPGPVQVNLPFDEPLLAPPASHPAVPLAKLAMRPVAPLVVPPAPGDIESAATVLRNAERPLVIAGPETGALPPEPIVSLAATLGAPILADPLSGLRTGPHDRTRVCDSYDAMLRDPAAATLAPDAVIRFGATPTSKALNQFLTRFPQTPEVLVDFPGSWRDPFGRATHRIEGDAGLAARALAEALGACTPDSAWADAWIERDRRAGDVMRRSAANFPEPFEGRVFTELQAALPEGATIVAGNSMPVRDLDSFIATSATRLDCVSNRGANGIDGVVSTALGAAAAGRGPVTLVIGDISFYHDMNGLWAARRHALDLTVVLVNNNGGGIFHYLPQAAHDGIFEEWFGTPPDLEFRPVVEMYGGRYTRATGWDAFRDALGAAKAGGLHVIELPTGRARNVAMHREAWAAANDAAWRPVPVSPA